MIRKLSDSLFIWLSKKFKDENFAGSRQLITLSLIQTFYALLSPFIVLNFIMIPGEWGIYATITKVGSITLFLIIWYVNWNTYVKTEYTPVQSVKLADFIYLVLCVLPLLVFILVVNIW